MDKFFTYPFRYTPSAEVVGASRKLISRIASDPSLDALFSEGKMLGVLVCDEGVLYGFSGLAGGRAVVEGFVPPIYDYTDPEGYFRCTETEISRLARAMCASVAGGHVAADLAAGAPDASAGHESACDRSPAEMSAALQDWLFGQYVVMNGKGEKKSIKDIFAGRGLVPPGGTGECAAPKLLDYAFRHGMTPRSMGEFWYGKSGGKQVRHQGHFYPSCTGKCGPLLTWMMQGLEVEPNPLDEPYIFSEPKVIFEDEHIIVADKPSGMLSVPGKTSAPCLAGWLSERYGEVHSCHRLDQDTGGVMVYARSAQVKAAIEAQFAQRTVVKSYRARLISSPEPFRHVRKGTIALPLMPDYYERPCQMVDFQNGKKAVTGYEVLEVLPDGEIDVRFRPLTGRTHQIRVHAAHPLGLGRPIKGDHLYGSADGGRLYLHAESLGFTHPVTGIAMTFSSFCQDIQPCGNG